MSRELLLAQVEMEEVGTWLAEVDPIVWIIAGIVLVILIGLLVLALGRKRQRREELRSRFGTEYDRAVKQAKSRKRAEQDLQSRWDRARDFDLRPLSVEEREDLKARWEDIQATFVDAPDTALRQADTLLDEASRARGYPDANIEQRFDDLSVEHPEHVAAFREARRAMSTKGSRPTTDQQRDAFLKLRALFEVVVERGDAERVAEPPPAYEHAGEETADRTEPLEEQPPTTSTADAAPATSPAEPPPAAPHPADPADEDAPQSGTGEPADEESSPPVPGSRF